MDDSTKKSNPIYSNTDTSKLNLSEEEWKKILPSDVYYIARKKVQNQRGAVRWKK